VLIGNGDTKLVDMDGLDLEMVNMWLARIHAQYVHPDSHPKLLRYQRECAKVLREYGAIYVASS
jgi:hypothetical protein